MLFRSTLEVLVIVSVQTRGNRQPELSWLRGEILRDSETVKPALISNSQIGMEPSFPGIMTLPDQREQHVGRQIHEPAFIELVRDSWGEVWHW